MNYKEVLTAHQMSDKFYDLFFDASSKMTVREYLDSSYCDGMGEIDFNEDNIKILYYVEGKYYNPPMISGAFSDFYPFVLNNAVHPDDRDIYADLMSPVTIFDNFKKSSRPGFRFAHFRFKMQDGNWRWVEQVIITGSEHDLPPHTVRFYVFDIHNAKLREEGQVNNESGMFERKHDELTSLFNTDSFFKAVEDKVKKNTKVDWAAVYLDIEHFKLFDEWYGRETGNILLARIGNQLDAISNELKGVGGYFGQDDFALLIPYELKSVKAIYDRIRDIVISFGLSVGFMPVIGVAKLSDFNDIRDAYDRASIACSKAKKNAKNRIQIYNPSMQIQSEKEYHAMLNFMEGLKNNEVTFYLQPQVRISSGKIVGAEALARWVKKDGTIVPPLEFIPVLEKFGFITDLDKYIWERVCIWLRSVIDQGIKPVPISLNVSQVDILTIDIAKYLQELIDKYNIPSQYIKVEITESAYAEITSIVDELVDKLRKMGLLVLMDDFGSGYSSLNMLSNVKLDAIKLDTQFLNFKEKDFKKGLHILESVINMSKSIALPIIIEGIETLEQSTYLEELGCRYAQGFYFYHPMTQEQFKELIVKKDIIDDRGFVVKTNEQFRIREFLDKNIYSDTMLNNILGSVAFYAWNETERVDIVRFNQQFYEAVGDSQFADRLNNIQNFMPKDDTGRLVGLLKEAMEKRLIGSSGVLHFYKTDGSLTYFLMKFYYLGDKEGTHRFYGSASNITNLSNLQQQVRLITKYTSDTIIFLSKNKEDEWLFTVACHGLSEVTELSMEELQQELNDGSIYKNHFDLRSIGTIVRAIKENVNSHKPFSMPLKFKTKSNKIIKLHMRGDVVDSDIYDVKSIITFRLLND